MTDVIILIYSFRVASLNSKISSFSEMTKKEIHNHIIQILKGKTSINDEVTLLTRYQSPDCETKSLTQNHLESELQNFLIGHCNAYNRFLKCAEEYCRHYRVQYLQPF